MSEPASEQSPTRRRFLLGTAAVAGSAALPAPRPGEGPKPLVLANNVGYEPTAAKRVVIASSKPANTPRPYQVVDTATGQPVFTTPPRGQERPARRFAPERRRLPARR